MSVNVTGEILIQLKLIRTKLTKELGSTPTWNMVIKHLLDNYNTAKTLKSKIRSKEKKIDEMHGKTEEYLKLALQRPTAPVMAMQQNNSPQQPILASPPPPPLSLKPPEPLKMIDIKATADVKNDFTSEIKSLFKGGRILKPSEIIQATNPDHAEEIIAEFDGDPPSLLDRSTCLKNTDKFKKQTI